MYDRQRGKRNRLRARQHGCSAQARPGLTLGSVQIAVYYALRVRHGQPFASATHDRETLYDGQASAREPLREIWDRPGSANPHLGAMLRNTAIANNIGINWFSDSTCALADASNHQGPANLRSDR